MRLSIGRVSWNASTWESTMSDYRSETSNSLPPRYHTTAQPNSSMHQFPMGPRTQQLLDCCTDSVHSFDLDYRDQRGSRSLNQKGRVRIIPADSGMGFEEWENKYKGRSKPQLSDFLDDEEDSVIFRMGRPYPEPARTPVGQNSAHSSFRAATYPEGYDTIDRRRKKRVDPGGLLGKQREEIFPSLLAPRQEKRGETFMRQVAEMQEEEERFITSSSLRPHKDGLLHKTRMWAKNDLDNTLENYVAYKKGFDPRARARFDFEIENSRDLLYPPRADKDINDIDFLAEDFYAENAQHYNERHSYEGHMEYPQGIHEKKYSKSKTGGWVPEAILSPVEEPVEEYVDPMDELQCLVETVSEYLAEKEEEISKYGSLPKSSKSRLSSLGSNRTDSFGEDQSISKDCKGETQADSDQGISGVKMAMSSLFCSISDKVGGGLKPPAPAAQAPSPQPAQSGITRLLSFIPTKANSTAPVAVVSPVETSPKKSFSSLPHQLPQNKTRGPQEPEASTRSQTQRSTRQHAPGVPPQAQSAAGNLVLGKLNPLKLFSGGEGQSSAESKQGIERTYSQGHILSDRIFVDESVYQAKQSMTNDCAMKSVRLRSSSHDSHLVQNHDENLYWKQNPEMYQQNVHAPEPQRSPNQTANTGFFSPFKKSFSSLITPAISVPPQSAPPVAVYPVFRANENIQLEKLVGNQSLSSKPKLPFLPSENPSTEQRPKADGVVLSGFLRFSSTEDTGTSMRTQNCPQEYHDSASSCSMSAEQQENTEKGWFSSMFNPSSNPSASTQRSNLHSQSTKVPTEQQHTSNQKPTRAPHGAQPHNPNQPGSQYFSTTHSRGSSVEDINQVGSNPPKPGLLSGLLNFGSTSDLSGSVPQQASNPPPRSNSVSQLPHHSHQQNSTTPQKGGLLSGLLKFSSTENIAQNMQPPDAEKQSKMYSSNPGQQQTSSETRQTQPQQKGLLSSLLRFASTENISNSQTVPQSGSDQHRQASNAQESQGLIGGMSNRTMSQRGEVQETCKPGFTRQQTVPLQQPSQQGGLLSGLFRFSSADSINKQNQPSAQEQGIPPNKSSHEQPRQNDIPVSKQNQPQNSTTQTAQGSGLFSGLFQSSSKNMTEQQPHKSTHETHVNRQVNVPCSQPCPAQTETSSQSGVLSGLFNKLTKTSESTDVTSQKSTEKSLQERGVMSTISKPKSHQNKALYSLANVKQQEHVDKDKSIQGTSQQGFLSGLFSKNATENQAKMEGQDAEQHTPITMTTGLTSDLIKSTTTDFANERLERSPPNCLNPGQSRHALITTPVAIHNESLDLRTSAAFARSLQSQTTHYSFSTGNLSQLYYSHSLPSNNQMAYSTRNIHSHLESHSTSPVMTLDTVKGGSIPALFGVTNQNLYQGSFSEYGISPSYDENHWIRESVLWQQFQNESLSHSFQGEDQGYTQNCEGIPLPVSTLHCSYSNINHPLSDTPRQDLAGHEKQMVTHSFEEPKNEYLYPQRKLCNSYEDLGNIVCTSGKEAALNLTTNHSNANFGKWHSFNDGSSYSLNGVVYHEGYYEETAPNLSYSANWQYATERENLQNVHTNYIGQHSQFNSNRNCSAGANVETEDSMYLEDAEWYQQWLSLLEQGMWWPAEDGDCGYFVYTDHKYIYALLTDAAGEYVYACTPEGGSWDNEQTLDSLPSAWLHNEMVLVCGFKIPLYNEDELLWLPGENHRDPQLLNAPLDLSAAYRKGNQIMNLNLEQFSEMFENSFLSQGQQGMDFTSYRLNKVRMDPRQPTNGYQEYNQDIIDLSCHKRDQTSPYWNNHEVKKLLAQKVSVSLNSTPAENSYHQLLYKCYQPSQRRRSSAAVTVKHVDDVSEDEWRKRVSPVEQLSNQQVKKISSLISCIVTKPSQEQLKKPGEMYSDQAGGKQPKNILSSGLQNLKSKIIKEDSFAPVTQSEKNKQMQRPTTSQLRILPAIPSVNEVTQPSTLSSTTSHKPRLSRQTTMVQQASPPTKPNVNVPFASNESLDKPVQPVLATDNPVDTKGETPPEQSQGGFVSFLKSAVGMDETKPDIQTHSQTSPNLQSKNWSTTSLNDSATGHKETTGVSNLFGSIGSLFSIESSPPPPQKQQMKPGVTEGSLSSTFKTKGIERQQSIDQCGTARPTQSQIPGRSISELFSPNLPKDAETNKSELAGQPKQEAGTKPSGGLFGLSIGDMLSDTGKSLGSLFSPAVPTVVSSIPQTEELVVCPCVGPVDNECHLSGMFPRGHVGGQDEAYTSNPLQVSPKRPELQRRRSNSPNVEESLHRKPWKCPQGIEDIPPHDLSSVNSTSSKASIAPAGENRVSQCQDGSAAEDDAISGTKNYTQEKTSVEEAGQGSGNIVEHILKELKGINKIQEEISDLRQYLTSVRGSVDEVSCCVDAVLSEIGELYCGASVAPQQSPVSQTPRIRRGSLGRQNAVMCLHERDLSPLLDNRDCGSTPTKRSTIRWTGEKETHGIVHRISFENSEQSSNPDLCYLELHSGQTYQSTSSLSSCHSSNCPEAGFLSGDADCSIWRCRGGWSEEDIFSSANSGEELENGQDVWKKEPQSGAAGHSSNTSSEHLSQLFGHQYKSSSGSSSMVGWKRLTNETEEENLECDCAVNCPFSRSSGYHTMDACADDLDSEPSRSLSCSTVLLTDCDDCYLAQHSPCDEYPSSADTLDLGSAESLDREWTDQSVSREEVRESLSQASSEMDSETMPKTPNDGFDETIFSRDVVTFRSAMKGVTRKLEFSNHEGVKDDADTDCQLSPSSPTRSSEPNEKQSSAECIEKDVHQTVTQFTSPRGAGETSQTRDNTTLFPQEFPANQNQTVCTATKYNSAETTQTTEDKTSNGELSSFDLTPNHSPAIRAKCPLDPISEHCPPTEGDQGRPTDASHRERIANFQRILREKRRTHHRLSRSTQGSQGSYGSQGSQGSQSQDEFFPGILKLFLFCSDVNTCRCINTFKYN
ncbi:hypothetical protein XENOCAPTIV_027208 [Xenoophorus captivus]|uniref:Unc-13 homolog B n=1 Tax=Xenoophorus captivus TaxID=1517983 RepID=A0ABV0QCA8_9TELE